jgi:hypothetical protein
LSAVGIKIVDRCRSSIDPRTGGGKKALRGRGVNVNWTLIGVFLAILARLSSFSEPRLRRVGFFRGKGTRSAVRKDSDNYFRLSGEREARPAPKQAYLAVMNLIKYFPGRMCPFGRDYLAVLSRAETRQFTFLISVMN